MWIIKLDGSLIGTSELNKWLTIVETNGDGQVIVVPGEGLMTEAIKAVQMTTKVDEDIVFRMSIRSLDQYGLLMTGINRRLVTARTELALAQSGWQHRGIVWLPSHMADAAKRIPMTKLMTSDSLAAWLAHKFNTQHLLIVKSLPVHEKQASADTLAKRGWVDAYFKEYIHTKSENKFKTWLLDKQYYYLFNESFDEDKLAEHALAVVE